MGVAQVTKYVSNYSKRSNAVLAIDIAAKGVYTLYITNKTECFSFKSGCVVRLAKLLKED